MNLIAFDFFNFFPKFDQIYYFMDTLHYLDDDAENCQ